jgi:chromosome segregation ATPase
MRRWLLASTIVATGLACILSTPTAASASEGTSQDRNEGTESPAKRIDRAIELYQSRSEQDLEQTRKEIAALRKELGELVGLQFDMAVSLAEMQAELRAQAADVNPGPEKASSAEDQERKRMHAMELDRELRQVKDHLRAAVQQRRSEVDQLVSQLRNLRTQQRKMESDLAQNKATTSQVKD